MKKIKNKNINKKGWYESYSGRKWRAPSSCPGALTWYTQKCRRIGCMSVKLKNPWKHVMSKECQVKAFWLSNWKFLFRLTMSCVYAKFYKKIKILQFVLQMIRNQLNLEDRFIWFVKWNKYFLWNPPCVVLTVQTNIMECQNGKLRSVSLNSNMKVSKWCLNVILLYEKLKSRN